MMYIVFLTPPQADGSWPASQGCQGVSREEKTANAKPGKAWRRFKAQRSTSDGDVGMPSRQQKEFGAEF
jgi:hypothetical protein